MLGLRRRIALTLVPNCVAIENSVSPGLTVHLTCWPSLPVVSVVVSLVVAVVDGVVDAVVVEAVVVAVVFAVVAPGGGGGGSGGGSGGGGSGGGWVLGTGRVSTVPTGVVDGGTVPSDGCPITPALDSIRTTTVTAPSNAAGARYTHAERRPPGCFCRFRFLRRGARLLMRSPPLPTRPRASGRPRLLQRPASCRRRARRRGPSPRR